MGGSLDEQLSAETHGPAWRALNGPSGLEQILELLPAGVYVCGAAGRITFCNRRAVQLWGRTPELDSDREKFCGGHRVYLPNGTPVRPDQSPTAAALHDGRPLRNVEAEFERPDGSRFTASLSIDPIFDANGRVQGTVTIFQDISRQKRGETELRQARDELAVQLDDMRRLHELGGCLAGRHELRELLRDVLDSALAVHGADMGLLSLADPVRNGLRVGASCGFDAAFLQQIEFVPAGQGACGQSYAGQRRVIVEDTETDPSFAASRAAAARAGYRAVHTTPLLRREGGVLGTLSVHFRRPRRPADRELRLMDLYARQAADLIEAGQLREQTRRELAERRQTEEALRESEERLRHSLAAARMGSWRIDLATGLRTRDANLNCILGHPPAETALPLADDLQSIHPQDRPAIEAAWQNAVTGLGLYDVEFRIVRPDGTVRWLREQGRALPGEGGAPAWLTGVSLDITEQKQAGEALRRLAAIVESSDDAIIGSDLDGRITDWNRGAERIFGYTATEIVAQPGNILAPSDRADELPDILQRIRRGGHIEHYETLRRRKDGVCIHVSLTVSPIVDADGHIIGISKVARDITERKSIEAELRQTEKALRATAEQLRLVTDHAPVFLMQCDAQHRFKFMNQTYAARFGLPREQVIGRPISEIIGVEAYHAVKHYLDLTFAGQRIEFELEVPYQSLGRRWVHAIHEPERAPTGEVIGVVGVIVDVTARKHAEQELERARDAALAASRAKDDFLATLSHELRTPLSPVLLLASDAAGNPRLPPEVRENFALIRNHISLEARLIDDLLDLTRITRGKMQLELQAVDAHAMLRDALATIHTEIEAKHLALDLRLGAQDSLVHGDAVRLQQVLWNVLKNAVKFTPEDGRITVTTGNALLGSMLIIEVSDTGIGMTGTELARAFDAFSQGEHAASSVPRRFGGLGLGLAISQKIIELHHGRIRAASEGRHRGTTIRIELPVRSRVEPHQPKVAPSTPATGEPAGAPGSGPSVVRLLLVEDHAPTRATLQQLLERRGFAVVPAATSDEAARQAALVHFDVLISDIGLPDGDGCQLMGILRQLQPDLQGIALSGYGMEDDLQRSQAAGYAAHLVKPINIEDLEKALAELRAPAHVKLQPLSPAPP